MIRDGRRYLIPYSMSKKAQARNKGKNVYIYIILRYSYDSTNEKLRSEQNRLGWCTKPSKVPKMVPIFGHSSKNVFSSHHEANTKKFQSNKMRESELSKNGDNSITGKRGRFNSIF